MSGLSLVNFLSQNLDDKELSVVIEGWLEWAKINLPAGDEKWAANLVQQLFNDYTQSCQQQGGPRLVHQQRVVEVFRELPYHRGQNDKQVD